MITFSNFTSALKLKLIFKAKSIIKANMFKNLILKRIIYLKKKFSKTIEVKKRKKELFSPNEAALSSHAEGTGIELGLVF